MVTFDPYINRYRVVLSDGTTIEALSAEAVLSRLLPTDCGTLYEARELFDGWDDPYIHWNEIAIVWKGSVWGLHQPRAEQVAEFDNRHIPMQKARQTRRGFYPAARQVRRRLANRARRDQDRYLVREWEA
jgi:hypothetical protein